VDGIDRRLADGTVRVQRSEGRRTGEVQHDLNCLRPPQPRPPLTLVVPLVGITATVKLRGPSRSEGHVSFNFRVRPLVSDSALSCDNYIKARKASMPSSTERSRKASASPAFDAQFSVNGQIR
jgi:hypothetical protein